MRKSEIDDLLGLMLDSYDNVSDLNITCDRPLQVAAKIPSIEELKLPEACKKMPSEKNGLILITGATGSGKTTSLAALLNEINGTKSLHVVTLEDPVEYVHPNRKATFNQRELGLDYDSFASGLRAALRQAPKIILVGEMRDREPAELALKASETGHPYLMMTFDQALLRSYEQGIITEETAIAYSTRKSVVQRGIDQLKQKRGEKTSDVQGLRLDADYNRRVGIKKSTMAPNNDSGAFAEQRLVLVCANSPERPPINRAG